MATLDVRPMMAEGGDPFAAIMRVVEGLGPGEEFELLAPLDPIPLYEVLGARGFEHHTQDLGGGDYRVVFRPPAATAQATGTRMPLVGAAQELSVFSSDGFGRRILFDGEGMRAVLVALEAGQEIPVHAPRLDVIVSVLAGMGRVMAGDEAHSVRAGDVAVIPAGARRGLRAEGGRLVALHVVSPPPGEADHARADHAVWPAPEPAPDVAGLIRHEHEGLHEEVDKLGVLAEALPMLNGREARKQLGEVTRFLREDLLSHAHEEERSVYPAVERVLGAAGGATRTMAVDHRHIAALVADLEDLAEGSISEAQQAPVRRVLHELRALLEVHLQKEEEVYLPLLARLSPEERRSLYAQLAGDRTVEES